MSRSTSRSRRTGINLLKAMGREGIARRPAFFDQCRPGRAHVRRPTRRSAAWTCDPRSARWKSSRSPSRYVAFRWRRCVAGVDEVMNDAHMHERGHARMDRDMTNWGPSSCRIPHLAFSTSADKVETTPSPQLGQQHTRRDLTAAGSACRPMRSSELRARWGYLASTAYPGLIALHILHCQGKVRGGPSQCHAGHLGGMAVKRAAKGCPVQGRNVYPLTLNRRRSSMRGSLIPLCCAIAALSLVSRAASAVASRRAPRSGSGWAQPNGTQWRTCVDDQGRQYCEQAAGGKP